MKRLMVVVASLGLLALVVSAAPSSAGGAARSPAKPTLREEEQLGPYCSRPFSFCAEPKDPIGPKGEYTGHDEPAVLSSIRTPGARGTTTRIT